MEQKKITEVELKTLKSLQQKEQQLASLNLELGKAVTQAEVLKQISVKEQTNLQNEILKFKETLETNYGEGVWTDGEGNIIEKEQHEGGE